MGIDLTEIEFDTINARVTTACNLDGLTCDQYANKSCPTVKGFWMDICKGYEKYFTPQELSNQVDYVVEIEETIEL